MTFHSICCGSIRACCSGVVAVKLSWFMVILSQEWDRDVLWNSCKVQYTLSKDGCSTPAQKVRRWLSALRLSVSLPNLSTKLWNLIPLPVKVWVKPEIDRLEWRAWWMHTMLSDVYFFIFFPLSFFCSLPQYDDENSKFNHIWLLFLVFIHCIISLSMP